MSDTSGAVSKYLSQSGVVFEKTDNVRGVIKEQYVSGDVFEQYYCKGDVLYQVNMTTFAKISAIN